MRIARNAVRLLAVLAVLILIGAAVLFAWLRSSLPQLDGEVAVTGSGADVEILRDAWGIPHIYAQTQGDAYFGLGYVHAQDRIFQMEQQRRLARGRLSELLGPATLETDRFLRLLDLHRAARASVAALQPDARAALEAYAAGVNAFLATHEGALAPELALLLAGSPEQWTAADSIAWMKVMALRLSGNWYQEALRGAMTARLGAAKAASFFPDSPAERPGIIEDAEGTDLAGLALLFDALLPPAGNGSNNWVADGRHTASGMPLLANDPHLGFTIPAPWYLAHLEAPGLSVAGATLPGMPLVIVGTNREIAWSVSNTGPDTQDIFVERLDPDDPGRYLTPEGTEPFAVRHERIEVRFGGDDEVTMLETRHGPVVTGLTDRFEDLEREGEVVALAWTMLHDDDRSIEAALALHSARDWEEFSVAARSYDGPMQNIIYADRHGNIGLLAPGTVPVRRSGDGLAPVEGWTGESDWIGRIPYPDLPRIRNPETGIIAAANDRLVGPDYPYFLARQWEPGYRGNRIREVLRERDDHDLASFTALQLDVRSGFAEAMLPHARAAEPRTDAGRLLQGHLGNWDGGMEAGLVAPTAFHAWYRELTRSIYRDDLGELFDSAWWFRPAFDLALMTDDPHGWCANDDEGLAHGCGELAGMAFDSAAVFLADRFGDDPSGWTWGEVHALRLRHRLFDLIPMLGRLTGLDVPLGGDRHSVAAAGYAFGPDEQAFATVHGPVLRAVIDLAEPVTGHFVILPGQSGNPFSPHYDDMVRRWAANDPLPIPFDRDHVDVASRLVLTAGSP